MPRSTFRLALVAGAGISSTYLLVGPVSLRKSTKIARPAQSVEDWRSFRARLLQREDTLTADLPETVSEEAWLHRSPLIEQGSVLISKLGTWSFYNPIFHKAVVLITEHEDDYSKGLILNRPTPRSETYGRLQFNVWAGGPFEGLLGCPELHGGETARQFCLHTQPLPDSDLVAPGIYATEPWAASRCIMESQAQVDDFMLFMGHCVWDRGQLQAELDQGNFWEMVATDTKALLGFLPRQQRALRRSRAGNTRAKLSRGFPLWQRFYRRVADGPDPILEGIPQDIRQRLEENQVEREADEELLRFVHEELDVRTASKSPPIPPPGTDEPPWMATMRQVLVHMQNELSSLQQENCCEALRLLIVDQQSRSVATHWGAVELVLSAMKVHSGEPGVQGHCAGTLTHLAAGPHERQKIFDSKGVDLVVHSMAKHYASSLVQYKGCAVLANLATDLRAQILVDKFLGSNAIQAIVRAMEQHADEQLVQDYCIGALFNISRAPANLLDLALTGGEKVVKAALARHPDAPTVRRVGQDLAQALESARP